MIDNLISTLQTDKLDFDSILTIADIGSRDGLRAIELSKLFKNSKTYTFECNPDTFPATKKNTEPYPRIEATDQAVKHFTGICSFYKKALGETTDISRPSASPDLPPEERPYATIDVKCTTLDDFLDNAGDERLDLILISAQDGALETLQGLSKRINGIRYMHIRAAHRAPRPGQAPFEEIDQFLQAAGFCRITQINRENPQEDVIYRNRREKKVLDKRVVLSNPWGGLGDNLQYTTLPELFAASGFQVWISAENKVRNPEISPLVWGRNPFIAGILPEAGTIGEPACRSLPSMPLGTPFISKIELCHGLTPVNTYPKIYYNPGVLESLKGKILIDIGSTSICAETEKLLKYVNFTIAKFGYPVKDVVQVVFKKQVARSKILLSNIAHIECDSLEEYCRYIASCRAFITVHSGAQSLAVSMRWLGIKPVIHCFALDWQFNCRDYIYNDVEYYIVS